MRSRWSGKVLRPVCLIYFGKCELAFDEAIYPIVANAYNGVELQAIAKRVETLTVKHPIMRDIEVSTF